MRDDEMTTDGLSCSIYQRLGGFYVGDLLQHFACNMRVYDQDDQDEYWGY